MHRSTLLFILISSLSTHLSAQTIGALLNTSEASHQFTLMSPVPSLNSYLIDNCGHIYNAWSSDYRLGMSSKLDKNGNLYRGGLIPSPYFNAGGKGGVLEKYNWDGDLEWSFELANDSVYLHHDFELMPDGNILLVAWEFISFDEIVARGRDSSITSETGFYSELILEIDPDNNFNTVWEWRAVDHIIQDRDPGKPSYGIISDNPQLIDINLNIPGNLTQPVDWLHINSIDYNEQLDQILLSCSGIDEIIIIDHSTSSEEAKGSTGGLSSMGGDILFRWGNESNFSDSGTGQQLLYAQHDANWIVEDDQPTDRILLFNNGLRIINLNYSTIDEIQLTKSGNYNYLVTASDQKQALVWRYNETADQGLYSKRMSGVRRISPDRMIISESDKGRIFEIDLRGNIKWTYINPVDNTGILGQGELPEGNIIFKAESYDITYFHESLVLDTDFEKIELNPVDNCDLFTSDVEEISFGSKLQINMLNDGVELFFAQGKKVQLSNIIGETIFHDMVDENHYYIDLVRCHPGIYILSVMNDNNIYSRKIYMH